MKALPIYQPYSGLIIVGFKKIETRPQRTNIRGTIGIYVPKSVKWDMVDNDVKEIAHHKLGVGWSTKYSGEVPAVVDIVDCFEMNYKNICDQTKEEASVGNWQVGRWGWVLSNPRLLRKPVKVKGHQGWINVEIPKEYLP